MIFVTVGSQKFQFNRLLVALDEYVANGDITDELFAQIGNSDYERRNYPFKKFLNKKEYDEFENRADIIISHGGTGAIMGALKKRKKVVAVPRLSEYKEHINNHQLEVVEELTENNIICSCRDLNNLCETINEAKQKEFKPFVSNADVFIDSINGYLIELQSIKDLKRR